MAETYKMAFDSQRPFGSKAFCFPCAIKSVSASKSVKAAVYGSPSSSASVSMTDLYWWPTRCTHRSYYSHAPLTGPHFLEAGETRSMWKEGGLKLQLHSLIAVSTGGPLRGHVLFAAHPPSLPPCVVKPRAQAFTLTMGSARTGHFRTSQCLRTGQTYLYPKKK